jgi:DNA-binding transcriptional ArsR family regulator
MVRCADGIGSQDAMAVGLTKPPARQKLHHLVSHNEERLSGIFSALGDPTRRAILARLARDKALSVSALAEPFPVKLNTVMKHLDVLSEVGLIRRTKLGRTVTVEIAAAPMKAAADWLRHYERFWSTSLDRLTAYAESKERAAKEKGK